MSHGKLQRLDTRKRIGSQLGSGTTSPMHSHPRRSASTSPDTSSAALGRKSEGRRLWAPPCYTCAEDNGSALRSCHHPPKCGDNPSNNLHKSRGHSLRPRDHRWQTCRSSTSWGLKRNGPMSFGYEYTIYIQCLSLLFFVILSYYILCTSYLNIQDTRETRGRPLGQRAVWRASGQACQVGQLGHMGT